MRRAERRTPKVNGRRGRASRFSQAICLGAIVSLLTAGIALADTVHNDVVAGIDDTIMAGGTTTVEYGIQQNSGDGQPGCNASDGSAATVAIHTPAEVSATPGSLTFASCGTRQTVQFSSDSPGDYEITVSVSDLGPGSYNVNPAKFTLHVLPAPPPSDTTPPLITPHVSGTMGNNGWYVSDVSVSWSVVDNESAISSTIGCGPSTIDADTSGTTLNCSATSDGGTTSESVTIKRDATVPNLAPTVSPNPVLLNGSATASPHASDNLSGVASASCDAVDTSAVGSKTVTCTATDNAGNSAGGSAQYSVLYNFVGFSAPVDNNGVFNVAKAGSAIPLKWRLLDANGVPVTGLGSVKVTAATLSCPLGSTADLLEETAAGASGLQNLGDGYYQFNWKTPSTYAKSCKTMRLDLGDGSTPTALFQFSK